MAIHSHSFGRVVLTEEDGAKFRRQAQYGRPNAAAIESVREGRALASQLRDTGSASFKLKTAKAK